MPVRADVQRARSCGRRAVRRGESASQGAFESSAAARRHAGSCRDAVCGHREPPADLIRGAQRGGADTAVRKKSAQKKSDARPGESQALQSIRIRCLAPCLAAGSHPHGVRASFRVPSAEVPPVLVRRSRFAVGRFPGFAVFPRRTRGQRSGCPATPLFEFRAPSESTSANPSRSAAADRLLSWAFAPYST